MVKNEIYFCGTNGKEFNKGYIPKQINVKNRYRDLENNPSVFVEY